MNKNVIYLVTLLLFIYNAIFTYIIINLTQGTSRFIFLILLAVDYVIIFYFVLQVAREIKAAEVTVKAVPAKKKGRKV